MADNGALRAAVAAADAHGLRVSDAVILRDQLNVLVHLRLHGDAHLNNVINGPGGPLWNDWEDTCLGPLGWDAACLKLTRDGGRRAEAALAASGLRLDPGELGLWVEARSLQVAVWRAFLAAT